MEDSEKPFKTIDGTLAFIRDHAAAYSVALAEREYLKEFRKSKKAILINEAEKRGIKTAQSREAYAYSHPDYLALLNGLKVAIEEAERLRLLIKSGELRIEVWKTQQFRASAEMRMT